MNAGDRTAPKTVVWDPGEKVWIASKAGGHLDRRGPRTSGPPSRTTFLLQDSPPTRRSKYSPCPASQRWLVSRRGCRCRRSRAHVSRFNRLQAQFHLESHAGQAHASYRCPEQVRPFLAATRHDLAGWQQNGYLVHKIGKRTVPVVVLAVHVAKQANPPPLFNGASPQLRPKPRAMHFSPRPAETASCNSLTRSGR